jgi:hypothetical protein
MRLLGSRAVAAVVVLVLLPEAAVALPVRSTHQLLLAPYVVHQGPAMPQALCAAKEVQVQIEQWRREYGRLRPNASLGRCPSAAGTLV